MYLTESDVKDLGWYFKKSKYEKAITKMEHTVYIFI